MTRIWRQFFSFLAAAAVIAMRAGAADSQAPPPAVYPELKTRDGKVFHECRVTRTEPDALVVSHRGGVARLSFFDLPEAVQQVHGFDPFAAMEYYKARGDWARDVKWKLFWEKQALEAAQAKTAEQETLLRTALVEWVPVEATVVRLLGDETVLARCKRVIFEKTKAKSKLGFEIDGPPRRKLVDFSEGNVVLKLVAPGEVGAAWKGYVNPVSEGNHTFQSGGVPQSAPAHRAATAPAP